MSDVFGKIRNTVQFCKKEYDDESLFFIEGRDLTTIRRVMLRLYSDMDKLSSDDMRDLAQLLESTLRRTIARLEE